MDRLASYAAVRFRTAGMAFVRRVIAVATATGERNLHLILVVLLGQIGLVRPMI
jgi:hypothetical protein